MTRFSKVLAAISAVGLAFSPIVAQAGTRAAASPVAVTVERGSAAAVDENGMSKARLLLLLASVGASTAALIAILRHHRSRG